ncbi:MAG: fumarylacetoacetase [Acidobacteria bacterium]|nr:fumarylacetoacetase [Acidobacteriota bacterium]
MAINETHDPNLESWVKSANFSDTDFPIQNLPFGIFEADDEDDMPGIGVAIGDQVLDLTSLAEAIWADDFFDEIAGACTLYPDLDLMLTLPQEHLSELRQRVSKLLRADNKSDERYIAEDFLIPMDEVRMLLPHDIGDYTDFYSSIYHATNIGKMFRPDQPLMPNYKWIPVGYHGRASSIVVSGSDIRRPSGQTMPDGADAPSFGPSKVLDYELEVGFFVGHGNEQGQPISIAEAEEHIFGLCLVNDWSARDIQRWEYQPLGPFLAKSFATTISPWIVTMEALEPFRVPAFQREAGDPQPLSYLDSPENRERGGFDIKLEVLIATEQMRQKNIAPHRLSASNTRDLYWTFAQMLAHHSSNGCNLRPGDLLASGTASGATKDSQGSLIELTERGSLPITMPTGEIRRFLEDGDEIILRGYCEREGFRRIGFGECRGLILPALG